MKKLIVMMSILLMTASAFAGKIDMKGSTTVLPIAQKAMEAYMALHPDVTITLSGGGSGNGVKALIDGTTNIGNSSRMIKPEEVKQAVAKNVYPVPHKIALDCIVPIVHKSNPVNDLTKEQLRDIYTGKITNWKQVGGPDMKIVVIERDNASGTFEAWKHLVMSEQRVIPSALTTPSNGGLVTQISTTKGGIGYIAEGYISKDVKVLSVGGVKGNAQTAKSGRYPISRYLFMFTNGWPEGETLDFINFIESPKGQEIVKKAGSIPLY